MGNFKKFQSSLILTLLKVHFSPFLSVGQGLSLLWGSVSPSTCVADGIRI